jgi:hypothetical protein
VAESFFATLKNEEAKAVYPSHAHAHRPLHPGFLQSHSLAFHAWLSLAQ